MVMETWGRGGGGGGGGGHEALSSNAHLRAERLKGNIYITSISFVAHSVRERVDAIESRTPPPPPVFALCLPHMIRPSSSVLAYCRRSKRGRGGEFSLFSSFLQ